MKNSSENSSKINLYSIY